MDALAYTALHLLRHLLEGSVSAFHVYELAQILERHADDEGLWRTWQHWHSRNCSGLRLCRSNWRGRGSDARWIRLRKPQSNGCPGRPTAGSRCSRRHRSAASFEPNKDELWLHLSLLDSAADRWSVARRRLLPARLPGPVDAVYLDQSQMSLRRRWLKRIRYGRYVLERVGHHAAALPRTVSSGALLWSRTNGPGGQFWRFLGAASLYNFALFIFVLLYNLHLLDLGYREDLLGVVSGSSTVGSVLGTIPAAFLARRFGLGNSLVGCFALTACITALRAMVVTRGPLIVLAFLSGLVFALWAVLMAPMIAQAVPEKRRPAAFSIFFATMIGIGIAGGSIGGRLPLWVHGKEPALLIAAGLVALAVWPAARLQSRDTSGSGGCGRPHLPARQFPAAVPRAVRALAPGHRLVQSILQRIFRAAAISRGTHRPDLLGGPTNSGDHRPACAAGHREERPGGRNRLDDDGHLIGAGWFGRRRRGPQLRLHTPRTWRSSG